MNMFELLVVLSKKFIAHTATTPVVELERYYPAELLTPTTLRRSATLHQLHQQRSQKISVVSVRNDVDPIVVLYAWCLGYGDMWDVNTSYSRFTDYVSRGRFTSITDVPDWAAHWQPTFLSIYQLLQLEQTLEDQNLKRGAGIGRAFFDTPGFSDSPMVQAV